MLGCGALSMVKCGQVNSLATNPRKVWLCRSKPGHPVRPHEGASNSASERLLQVVYFFGLVFGTLGRRDIHNSINIVTTRKKR